MENNPFKKIILGSAVAASAVSGSAEASEIQPLQTGFANDTEKIVQAPTSIDILKKAADSLEHKLAKGTLPKILEIPTAAIYAEDDLLQQVHFDETPQFSSRFWAQALENNLVNIDQKNSYLDRSAEGMHARAGEKALTDEGFIDPATGGEQSYVAPGKRLIVSVDKDTATVRVIVSDKSEDKIISEKITENIDETLNSLTSQVLSALQ